MSSAELMAVYNFARQLERPCAEYIANIWRSEPARSIVYPIHHYPIDGSKDAR